jgi:hypothetical protein
MSQELKRYFFDEKVDEHLHHSEEGFVLYRDVATLTAERDALREACKSVTIAFGDDEYLMEWAEREDNQWGSKIGIYLDASKVKAIFAALAKSAPQPPAMKGDVK